MTSGWWILGAIAGIYALHQVRRQQNLQTGTSATLTGIVPAAGSAGGTPIYGNPPAGGIRFEGGPGYGSPGLGTSGGLMLIV